jgi:hypothetical protein
MRNLTNFLSSIQWKKMGKYGLFYVKVLFVILARLVYLLGYELFKLTQKVGFFLHDQVLILSREIKRRKVFLKIKKALHLTAVVTWILSKNLTKQLVKQTKKFVIFMTPYVKSQTRILIKYSKRIQKRVKVIITYVLIRIQKTNTYKNIEHTTKQKVIKPLLATATSRKPYALALMVIVFVTSSLLFLNDERTIEAATATWTQTDWSGGVGTSTTNQYTSSSNLTESTDLTLTATGSWYNSNWGYRKAIVIDNTKVSGSVDLTNFVALVSATSTDWKSVSNGGNVTQADGGDIVFTNSSGTKLDHEIDLYTASTGNLIAWVEIDTLEYDADTTIYMYYGNDAGSLDESSATGTWSGYSAVWQMSEEPTTASAAVLDSTSNNYDLTGVTVGANDWSGTELIDGKINKAIQFNDNYLQIVDTPITEEDYTVSAWVKVEETPDNLGPGIFSQNSTGDAYGFQGAIKSGTISDYINGGALSGSGGLDDHTVWNYLTWGLEPTGDIHYLLINGVNVRNTGTANAPAATLKFNVGSWRGHQNFRNLTGEMDHMTISPFRTDDWVATEYANQNAPETFSSEGTEESQYSTSGELISASFDTGEATSLFSSVSWSETLPTNTDVKFQIRTAPDDGGSAGTYTSWLGPTGTGDYYTDPAGGETINSTHTDGSDDQWVQYQAFLSTTDATVTSTLSDVTVTYVSNGAPNFNDDYPTSSAGGSQVSAVTTDGNSTVTINYSVRDADSTGGSSTPGYITPSFEYSLNGGSTWTNVTSTDLGASDLSNKAVDESTYNIYEATWDAETAVGSSVYVTNAQIRVTADDNEGGNNTATSTTANFTLDTTPPSFGSPDMTVDASVSPADVTITCTDDTAIQQKTGLSSDLSDGSYSSYTGTTTASGVGTPSDIVYGQCKDAHGNETAIQSVTTPTQPTSMFYQDISDTSTSDYKLFISWSTVSAPAPGFASYKLYRSTDGSSYSLHDTIATRTTNYYIDTGLSTGTTYYYKLTSNDDDGNVSAYSSVVSDDPDGFGGTDNTPPAITSASSVSTPTEATITWTTDELSNSTVYYTATTSDPGTTSGNYDSSQGVGSFVISHSVAIANLTPGTQYYYLVRSTDVDSNIGTDSSSGTFTTGAGVSISSVTASPIYNEEATVTWTTDSAADSTIYYSVNSDMSSSSSLNSATEVTAHSVNIPSLTGGTKYYYYVQSEEGGNTTSDKNVVDGVTEYYDFTTTSDSSAPTITSVNNALIGETGVTVAWTTDEGSTSQVAWGLTTALGSTTTETAVYTTQHAVTLTGLDDTTKYYYRVRSEDRANNSSIDDNSGSMHSVTTNPPGGGGGGVFIYPGDTVAPTVDDLGSSPNQNSATVTFTTDEPSGVLFQYGSGSYDENEINKTNIFQTSHLFNLSDLEVNTTYYYRITTIDTSSNERTKSGSFSTEAATNIEETEEEGNQEEGGSELDLGEVEVGEVDETIDGEIDIAELTRNASEGTVREVLGSIFDNSNLFSIPSDFLLASASKLAANFNHSVVSNEDLEKIDQEFLFENLRVAGVTGQSATLIWRTTTPTKTVLYLTNLQTGQTRELEDRSFLLSHEYTVNKLVPTGSYSVQVVAENELGERLGSQSLSFSTFVDKKPPLITDLKTNTSILAGKENKVQAIISWKTNKPATSKVLYEVGVGEGDEFALSSVLNQSYSYDHVVVISGLVPGQIYRLRAESIDGQSNTVYSSDRTLMTPRSKESIVDVIIENFEQTFNFLR